MTNPYRAMCDELVAALDEWQLGVGDEDTEDADLIARARALLAEPVAEWPTDEELDGVMFQAVWECMDNADDLTNDETDRLKARAVLAKWGHQ